MKKTLNSITQCSIIGGVYLINFISFIYSISLEIYFPYEKFINPKSVVRLFFDILHGIDRADIPLVVALEFAILLGYDGQLKQNSDMEKELFQSSIDQLKKTKMSKLENAMIWLYVKTWGLQGQHVIDESALWNFGDEDLESAIIGIAYPRKQKKIDEETEDKINLIEELRKLIMGKFDDNKNAFYEWSQTVHEEVRL